MNHNYKAYPLIFTVVFTAFVTFTYGTGRYAYGLYLPDIEKTFSISTLSLGLIASAATMVFVITTLISSILAQRMRAIWMICISGIVTSLGCFLVFLSTAPSVLVVGIIMASACVGVAPPCEYRIIDEYLAPKWQNRAIACLNCGGTIGILAVGGLSYALPGSWQQIWLVFAGCALIVTILAVLILPAESSTAGANETRQTIPARSIYRPGVINLALLCVTYGFLLGCYYTYSAKLLSHDGGYGPTFQEWFWILVGASGLITVFSGDLISRQGVKFVLMLAHALSASSCVLIVFFINDETAVVIAAVTFGIGSMIPGSALLIWSMQLYKGYPSIAFGVMFAFLSLGQASGSAISGFLSDTAGLSTAFLTSAVVILSSLIFIPANASEAQRTA